MLPSLRCRRYLTRSRVSAARSARVYSPQSSAARESMPGRLLLSLIPLIAVVACSAPQAAPARGGAAPPAADKPAAAAVAPAPTAPSAAPVAAPAARQPLAPRARVTFAHLGQASDAGVYIGLE